MHLKLYEDKADARFNLVLVKIFSSFSSEKNDTDDSEDIVSKDCEPDNVDVWNDISLEHIEVENEASVSDVNNLEDSSKDSLLLECIEFDKSDDEDCDAGVLEAHGKLFGLEGNNTGDDVNWFWFEFSKFNWFWNEFSVGNEYDEDDRLPAGAHSHQNRISS